MKTFSKILLLSILILGSATAFHVRAATTPPTNDYVVLAPLPGIGGSENGGKTNLQSYIPAVFRLSIALAAGMAFVVLVFGGVMYATSDAISGKSQGRDFIENALWGLLLVIGAYAILYTINPQILEFNLNIPKPATQTSPTATAGGTVPGTIGNCIGCTSLSSIDGGIRTNGNTGISVAASFAPQIGALDVNLKASGIPWVVTEGYPPSGIHSDACHASGTCVDARPSSPTVSNINGFYSAARQAGLAQTNYEVSTQSAKDSLIASGVTVPISVNSKLQGGPHFHVK